MTLIRLLVALLWLPLRLFMVLLGVVAVPVALWYYDRTGRWPWLLETWHNLNDPVWDLPDWYTRLYAPNHNAISKRWPRFWWFAVRNPANNMRKWLREPETYFERKGGWEGPMEPGYARLTGRTLWRYRYKGIFGEIWVIRPWNETHHFRFRFGFKLGQRDGGTDALGYAIQLMPWRRG